MGTKYLNEGRLDASKRRGEERDCGFRITGYWTPLDKWKKYKLGTTLSGISGGDER